MAYNDFFSNKLVLKIIDDLKNDNAELEREKNVDEDVIRIYDRFFKLFNMVTDKDETYTLELLKKEYKDFYIFLHYRASKNPPHPDIMVPNNLILYALIKHFPDKLEKYLSLDYKTAKKMVKTIMDDYNKAFNIT